MGSGSVARGSASARLHNHKASKYASASTHYYSPSRQRSPSPPRWRIVTQAEINAELARRAKAERNYRLEMEAVAAREKKALLEAEARKIANKIKQNNRLAAAAAANVNNKNNLKKIFKNNKTILSRLRHLAARLRR